MTYGCIAQVAIPTNWTRHRRPFARSPTDNVRKQTGLESEICIADAFNTPINQSPHAFMLQGEGVTLQGATVAPNPMTFLKLKRLKCLTMHQDKAYPTETIASYHDCEHCWWIMRTSLP